MKQLSVFFFMMISTLLVQSQNGELGVAGGVSLYSGDLSPKEFGVYFEQIDPAFGVFGRVNTGKTFSFRIGLSKGRVSESDSGTEREVDRGLNFRSDIWELALTAELNLFRIGNPDGLQLVPFLFGGAAFFHFNPEASFDGNWIELQPLGTEGQSLPGYAEPYSLNQLALPMGGGLKFIINESFTIGLELGGRKLFSDYLDDVSDTRVNYLDVLTGNGTLAAQLSNPQIKTPDEGDVTYRRGGKYNDWYYFSMLTLSYHLNGGGANNSRGLGCPNNF